MAKVRVTCNKNIIERFGVQKPEGWDFQYINYPCSDEELVEQCKDADIVFCGPVDHFRREVVEQLDNCKLIHSLGVGFDKIDLAATKGKGIFVCNKGQFELSSRVIGLVGLGAIGKALVSMLKPFGCKIYYYDVFRASEDYEKENGIEYATYETILEKCDIISYHVPVLDETRDMVRKETIDKMKDDAIIINVSRGEIVNSADLAEALNNGKIFAGLDVIAPEPPPVDHPILNLTEEGNARLSITPHIAGTTDDAFIRMSQWSYENMVRVMNGERPNNIVNSL